MDETVKRAGKRPAVTALLFILLASVAPGARGQDLPSDVVTALAARKVLRISGRSYRFSRGIVAGRYMEENVSGACSDVTLPNWEGFPLKKCTYEQPDGTAPAPKRVKRATVIMLNPERDVLAKWIIASCMIVRGREGLTACADKLAYTIIDQSGSQFAVAGVVLEDQKPVDGVQEAYIFRDGVTVTVEGGMGVGFKGLFGAAENDIALDPNRKVLATASESGPARIQSTSRAMYRAYMRGLAKDVNGIKWLDVVRGSYQDAWRRAHDGDLLETVEKYRNDLMVARCYALLGISPPRRSAARVAGTEGILLMKASTPTRYALALAMSLMSGAGSPSHAVQGVASPCSFSGPDVEQAKCLLRRVRKYGEVERDPATLPPSLERLIGRETSLIVTAESLARYLTANGIKEEAIGGPLSRPVSKTSGGAPAAYFIIHDTSDPTYERRDAFPPDGMDTQGWPGNTFARYLKPTDCHARRLNPRVRCEPVAHVFINRVGQSVTGHDFSQGWRSTQYENQSAARRGLFLAVENIQPRRKDANDIDAEAPDPGFTDAQLDRLALVYVAASVRRGRWLIPAFHAVIDIGVGTHDDPQNFDLGRWAERLDALLQSIR